jgi:glycosyltransferase involved in cell wall biosynthesis
MFNGMNFRKIFYYAIEFILSYFTDIYYAISPREFHIASRMKYAKIIKGCNYVSHITGKRKRSRLDSFTIGMMGRVERQKNPKLFAKFAVKFREIHSNSNINFVWIGTGDSDICSLLERSGVKVTGWMNREDALIKLSSVDLLVHTALWEGSPLTTLEALNFDVPVIAYGHPSMVSLGYSYFTDLESLIRKTSSLYLNRDRYLDTVQVGKNILCKNSLKACRHSLMSAYN